MPAPSNSINDLTGTERLLIHDKFIYLHLPKTGGTFITEVLRRELPVEDGPGHTHSGWGEIPADMADKPVISFVRNPWDWYVSYYHFLVKNPDDGTPGRALQRRFLVEGGPDDFATAVRNACQRMSDPSDPVVKEMLAQIPEQLTSVMVEGHDFYSAAFLAFTGRSAGSDRVAIGRFEHLADDLQQFLTNAGVADAERVGHCLRVGQPVNTTERRHYREYYDDELRDLVGNSCRIIIDQFGYRF